MRIGIIGWRRDEQETGDLVRAARELGQSAHPFILDDVRIRTTAAGFGIDADGLDIRRFDLVISRAHTRLASWQRDLEALTLISDIPGLTMLDPIEVTTRAENKLCVFQRVAGRGVPVIQTVSCRTACEVAQLAEVWQTVVVKPSAGWGAHDAQRISFAGGDAGAGMDTVQSLLDRYGTVLCQPFHAHPRGDIRIVLVGAEPVLSYRHTPADGQWRADPTSAEGWHVVPVDGTLLPLAVKAVGAVGLSIAAGDFLDTDDGYLLIEVNGAPSWFMLDEQARLGIARRAVEHAVRVREGRAGPA